MTTATPAEPEPVQVLVTNDDGVGAPGIDALVEALRDVDGLVVSVVAPAGQRSGSGGSTTEGTYAVSDAATASGVPAKAVDAFPADTVIWAVDRGGLEVRPDLVISGINEGQNLGPFLDLSGTVGAARAAAMRGIPAIAVSQGFSGTEGVAPDFEAGADAVVAYLEENLDRLLANDDGVVEAVVNINVPTCGAGSSIRGTAVVPAQPVVADVGVATGPQDCSSAIPQPSGDVDALSVGFVTVSAVDPLPARAALEARLADELGAEDLAAAVSASVGDDVLARLNAIAGAALLTHPVLSFTPETMPDDDVESLWVFAFGYRFAPGVAPPPDGGVPPMEALIPGPVNEALARAAADFVAEHPVPVVAQQEVAQLLEELGVDDVVSVGPDVAADGSVTYLSTAGVVDKGLRLAAEAGVEPGVAGLVCFADHAVRCQMTTVAAGLNGAVPAGVSLPRDYDPESGQPWTRDRVTYVATDLLARSLMAP